MSVRRATFSSTWHRGDALGVDAIGERHHQPATLGIRTGHESCQQRVVRSTTDCPATFPVAMRTSAPPPAAAPVHTESSRSPAREPDPEVAAVRECAGCVDGWFRRWWRFMPLASMMSVTSIGAEPCSTCSTVCRTPLSVTSKSAAVRPMTARPPRLTDKSIDTPVDVARKTGVSCDASCCAVIVTALSVRTASTHVTG